MSKLITREMVGKVTRVIYHSPCQDGFGAAYAFMKYLGFVNDYSQQIIYTPASYNIPKDVLLEKIKDLKGEYVVYLDFCSNPDIMDQVLDLVEGLLILDHHKTSFDLSDRVKEHAVLDMDKSGIRLAWEFCFPNTQVPRFAKYIEDGDLWKWKYSESKAFNLAISNDNIFKYYYYNNLEDDLVVNDMIKRGELLLSYRDNQVKSAIEKAVNVNFRNYNIMVTNCTENISELGNKLAELPDIDFAMIWFYNHKNKNIKVCLRSLEQTSDVSEVAKLYGGGGHRCASGFVWNGDIESLLKGDESNDDERESNSNDDERERKENNKDDENDIKEFKKTDYYQSIINFFNLKI